MAFKDAVKSVGNDLIGNIETAYLVVSDYRAAAAAADALGAEEANRFTNTFTNMNHGNKLSSSAQSLIASQASKMGNAVRNQAMKNAKPMERVFKVQFNPSEIQIYGANIPTEKSNSLGGGQQSISNAVNKPRIEMTVQLLFDDMNLADSFMWEKFGTLVSAQGITNIATAAAKVKDKVWSVQPQVEGLVSALRNPYTRNVAFHWADFTFTGQVSAIMAQYTMFSTSGRPVRAKVVLRLRHEMDADKLEGWYKDFKQAFGVKTINTTAGTGQKVGNLLNIGR